MDAFDAATSRRISPSWRRSRHSGPWVRSSRRCRRCYRRYSCRGEQLCPQRSMVRILLSFVVFLSPRRRLTRFLSPCSRRSAVVPLVIIGSHSAAIPDLCRRGYNVESCRVDSDLSPPRFQRRHRHAPQHWRSVVRQVSKSYAKQQPRREQHRQLQDHLSTSANLGVEFGLAISRARSSHAPRMISTSF